MNPSDEALVLACKRGDERSWEALIERYQRLIYSIPRRAGLDEEASSDIFQNVFANLIEKLDRIEQPERIQAWLVTTTKRETWRFVERRNARRTGAAEADDDDDVIERLPANAPLPDDELVRLEEQHAVRTALASLDERCNRLLTALFYCAEPPSYSDVAATMGISPGSIGPTRARCLQKLLRALKESGFR